MIYYLKIVYIFISLVIYPSILFANMEEPPSSNVLEVSDAKVETSIDNIIKLIKKETRKSFKIVITGGLSNLFQKSIKTKVVLNKDITIKGLIKISNLIK